MIEKVVLVQNARGIHLRPSGLIAAALRDYSGKAWVVPADGGREIQITSSPLSIMGLSLRQGDVVILRLEGEDEAEKLAELAGLFSKKYDFT